MVRVNKRKVIKYLYAESKDKTNSIFDRFRYKRIIKKLYKLTTTEFKNCFDDIADYKYYETLCYVNHYKVMSEIEYKIVLATIENIKSGYYEEVI